MILPLLLISSLYADCPTSCDITQTIAEDIESCYRGVLSDCVIELGFGTYTSNETISLCGIKLRGKAKDLTSLSFPLDTSGLIVEGHGECGSNLRPNGEAALEDLEIIGSTQSSTITVGLTVSGKLHAQRLHIHGFTVGVLEKADALASPPSNANTNYYSDIRVHTTKHAQWLNAGGGDTNASVYVLIKATAPGCTEPGPYVDELGGCGGIVDHSFLGNTWIAPHVAGVGAAHRAYRFNDLDALPPRPPGTPEPGANAATVVLGAYSEGGQGPSWAGPLVTVLSGQNGVWEGPGLVVLGPRMNNIRVVNDSDPANVVQVEMGDMTGAGVLYALRAFAATGGAWPFRVGYNTSTFRLNASVGNFGPTFCGYAQLGPESNDLEVSWCPLP